VNLDLANVFIKTVLMRVCDIEGINTQIRSILESFNERKGSVSGCDRTYNAKKGDEFPVEYQN
jgi:hypothetical protein